MLTKVLRQRHIVTPVRTTTLYPRERRLRCGSLGPESIRSGDPINAQDIQKACWTDLGGALGDLQPTGPAAQRSSSPSRSPMWTRLLDVGQRQEARIGGECQQPDSEQYPEFRGG